MKGASGRKVGLPAFTGGRSAAAKAGGNARGQKLQRFGRQANDGTKTPAVNAGRPAEAALTV